MPLNISLGSAYARAVTETNITDQYGFGTGDFSGNLLSKEPIKNVQKRAESQIDASQAAKNTFCWMRSIQVKLHSRECNRTIEFNTNSRNQFNIDIVGAKYLALTKDKGTVTISNLEYDTIVQIINGKYYDIEIYVGYEGNGNLPRIFKGEVSFISQKIWSAHDVDTYICFASTTVARYSQARMNYNLNSGINLYAALNYICRLNGVNQNAYIDPELKAYFLQSVYSNYCTFSTVFDNLTAISGSYTVTNVDESDGNVINCTTIKNKRQIAVDPNTIIIKSGNPTVSSDGMRITLLPTMNFKPGDILILDNGMFNTSIQSAEAAYQEFPTNYLDRNGMYMIIEIEYHFQNRGEAFEYRIKGRALDIITRITGEDNPVTIRKNQNSDKANVNVVWPPYRPTGGGHRGGRGF